MTADLHPYFSGLFADSEPDDLTGDANIVALRRRAGLIKLMSTVPRVAVELVTDVSVPAGARVIPCRLYHPRPLDPMTPLAVYVHGGGWVAGDLDTHDPICRRIAVQSGNAVLAVDHRRAPEHPYPAAFEDINLASEWAAHAGNTLAVDTARGIALVGESSGANLVAAAMLANRESGDVLHLRAQVLTHPPLDFRLDRPSHRAYGNGYGLTNKVIEYMWDQYVPLVADRLAATAAPLNAESLDGLPPTLLQLAELDPLRSEGEEFAARMRSAGNTVVQTMYHGVPHGFQTAFHRVPQAAESLSQIATFLRQT